MREPAAHLALQHRLPVGRREPLAVDRPARSGSRAAARRRGSRPARRAPRRSVSRAGRARPAPTSGRGAACVRMSVPKPAAHERLLAFELLSDVPASAAPARRRTSTPRSTSRSSAMRCCGIGAGRGGAWLARVRGGSRCTSAKACARSMSPSACFCAAIAAAGSGSPRPGAAAGCGTGAGFAGRARGRRGRRGGRAASTSFFRSASFAIADVSPELVARVAPGNALRSRAARALQPSAVRPSRYASASSAAMQPVPADVTACR